MSVNGRQIAATNGQALAWPRRVLPAPGPKAGPIWGVGQDRPTRGQHARARHGFQAAAPAAPFFLDGTSGAC